MRVNHLTNIHTILMIDLASTVGDRARRTCIYLCIIIKYCQMKMLAICMCIHTDRVIKTEDLYSAYCPTGGCTHHPPLCLSLPTVRLLHSYVCPSLYETCLQLRCIPCMTTFKCIYNDWLAIASTVGDWARLYFIHAVLLLTVYKRQANASYIHAECPETTTSCVHAMCAENVYISLHQQILKHNAHVIPVLQIIQQPADIDYVIWSSTTL